MINAVMWVNLEITLSRERGREASSTYKPTRRIDVVPRGWETGWGVTAHRHRVSFWGTQVVVTQRCECTKCPELCALNRLISSSVNFTLIEKKQWSKDFSHIWPFSLRFSRSGLSSFFSPNTSTQMQFIYCNAEHISEGICNESGAETPSLQYRWLGPTAGIHGIEAAGPAGPSSKPGWGPHILGGGEGAACLGDRVGGPQEVFQPAGTRLLRSGAHLDRQGYSHGELFSGRTWSDV